MKLVALLRCAVVGVLVAGCSTSVHTGNGDPIAEKNYKVAIAAPMRDLTTRAISADDVCAGGSNPSHDACYSATALEITAVRTLQASLHSIPTPERFTSANRDLVAALDSFAKALTARNAALAEGSTNGYLAAQGGVDGSKEAQRKAFAEFPADARITIE
jgi:hypothetical protein